MDFLDPKAKRNHTIRLFIGYALMAIVILTTSAILVFSAYGFDVNRKTGEVIQNGLVFVDSAPDDATVYFNKLEQREKTNNRFSLPSGQYNLEIKKEGYRDWSRNFAVNGGEVERFTYPLLLPTKLEPQELENFEAAPGFVTESPDRRWAILGKGGSLTDYTEYDLNTLADERPVSRQFTLSPDIFSKSSGPRALELVEWSSDNKNMLVKHTFGDSYEFIIISRDQPETSFNINALLGQNPTSLVLKDKKFDQWFIHSAEGGILQTANAKKVVTPLLTGVTNFKTHGEDTIIYTQSVNDGKNQRVTLLQDDKAYVIKDIASGPTFLDIARYEGAWHLVVGSEAENRTYIYKDPQTVLQRNDSTKPAPISILKSNGAMTSVSFSQNTRFIVTQSGQHFEVYDAEYNQYFKYDILEPLDVGVKVVWMDGHRLLAKTSGKAFIFDFNGNNKQELLPSSPNAPVLFDRDYTFLYNVNTSALSPERTGFYATQLRLESDR